MSDTPTRTPATIERLSSASNRGGGFGSMFTILLAVACVLLIGACFYISSGKKEMQGKIDSLTVELNDTKSSLAAKDQTLMTRERDVTVLKNELSRSIPMARLPSAVQAPTAGEVLAKIQQMADSGVRTTPGPTPLQPGNDTPVAWLETITKQVLRGSINTKEPIGADPAKLQMHKGIQSVLNKIGAYPKVPTGNNLETYEAVMGFQKANGLKPDGIIGKGTWGKVREKFESVAAAH